MKNYCIAVLLLLLTQGCSEQLETVLSTDPTALVVDVQVEGGLQSRSIVTGSSFITGSTIAVVVKNGLSTENNYGPNGTKKVFTLSGTGWDADSSLSLGQAGKVTAYYPSNLEAPVMNATSTTLTPSYLETATLTDVKSSNLTLKGSLIYIPTTEIDYLVGSGTDVSGQAIRTAITLRHAMSMVGVRLIRGATYSDYTALTKIIVQNKPTRTPLCSGTVNVLTNDFTPITTPVSYTRTISGYNGSASGQPGLYVAFLAYPAILYENGLVELKLTVDAKEYTVPLLGREDGTLSWKAGNCILYDITINGTEITITNVTVNPWQNGNSNSNIEIQ